MDTSTVNTPPKPALANQPLKNSFRRLVDKFSNFSGRQKLLTLAIFLILISGLVIWLINAQPKSSSDKIIATVGGTPLPKNYLDIELEYYPGTPSAEIKKKLTQKIIDDEITLQSAKTEGLINKDYQVAPGNKIQYTQRSKAVAEVKKIINNRSVDLEAEVVSIWFYNNGYIGPYGYDKGRDIAFRKINQYYDQVQSKKITIQKAGELIAADQELINSRINISLKENSYLVLKGKKGQQMSFWPEFDTKLWDLSVGELTNIFTGTDINESGKTIPILYAFGQLTKKDTTGDSRPDYDQWLLANKKNYEITY